jgi:hypothetical protein
MNLFIFKYSLIVLTQNEKVYKRKLTKYVIMDKLLKIKTRRIGLKLPYDYYLYITEAKQLHLTKGITAFIEDSVADKIARLIDEGKLTRKINRRQ